jgi:hypothetical protein
MNPNTAAAKGGVGLGKEDADRHWSGDSRSARRRRSGIPRASAGGESCPSRLRGIVALRGPEAGIENRNGWEL